MAMALEARGFGMSATPTSFIDYPMSARDYTAFAALIAVGIGQFVIYYAGYGAISPK
jgi:energy-coupling factor transporter transmembrane protein EcfT